MPEKRYVDILIVMNSDQLFVAEDDSGRIHIGDLVEIEPIRGERKICEVVDDAMFDEVGGERYKWIGKLHPIHPVVRSWSLNKCYSNE